jgi:hypothetical protein
MLPLIPIAIELAAQYGPELIGKLMGKNAEAVAGKVVEVAQAATGTSTPAAALEAVKGDPEVLLKFKAAIGEQMVELERIAAQASADVNATMRAEVAAEHWPSYSWRPAIGFAVAIDLVGAIVVTIGAYAGVMFFNVKPEVLTHVPSMIGALSALVAVASPILGIASWFRGKMQADPNIPTVNRG